MRLPAAQRSSVILMDVLGYSLEEVGGIVNATVPAVKAHLHRGRERLRVLAKEPDEAVPPPLTDDERARLAAYVARFNARDFDAVRDMLGDDVRLELVNHSQRSGRRAVGSYFENYARIDDWQLVFGFVDLRPAIIVVDPMAQQQPRYFVVLTWSDGRLATIRDFRHARYAIDGADVIMSE
jgi:RNA polymerase sigma-70 factor (ECF subfamily)